MRISIFEVTGILLWQELRKRKTPQKKSPLFSKQWNPTSRCPMLRVCMVFSPACCLSRKQYQEGSLTAVAAGEDVVPASELAAAITQIKELQRLLSKKHGS